MSSPRDVEESVDYVFMDYDKDSVEEFKECSIIEQQINYFAKKNSAEWLANKLKDSCNMLEPVERHMCELLTCVFGMYVINCKVDLDHKTQTDITHRYDVNQRQVVTEVIRKHVIYFREIHESYQGSGIWRKQDHVYSFDPRTRKGKLLEHCFFCLRAIQELKYAYDDIQNNMVDRLHQAIRAMELGED